MEESIHELQSVVTHLQRDLQQMSDVVRAQELALQKLRADLTRMQGRLTQLESDDSMPPRDPLDERPPHY